MQLNEAADSRFLQKGIRKFLKARTSYDVMPLSFRLIVFDTTLLVKRSLSILIQNGKFSSRGLIRSYEEQALNIIRDCFGTSLGLEDFFFRWTPDHFGLYQCHSVLLAESGSVKSHGSVSLE